MGATTPKIPIRMAVLYMPNGVNTTAWTPQGSGRDFTLSPTLEPLQDLKNDVVVMSNMWNAATKGGDGHYVKEAAILTCTTIRKTPGADLSNGISMDQVAAQRVGEQTPLPSLELGISPVAIGIDAAVGYTRIYGSHIAWSSPSTPLARETNPRSVYERLFRASSVPQGNTAKMDTLLLDRVLGDAKRLRAQVGTADRLRLDEYLGPRLAPIVMPVYYCCAERKLPVYTIAHIDDAYGRVVAYERLLLPFCEAGNDVTHIIASLKTISEDGGFEIRNLMRGNDALPTPKLRAVIDRDLFHRAPGRIATGDLLEFN